MAREQRKLAAIVAADVVGYSRLMGRDESGTLARLRKNRSQHLDPVLAKYGGRLVKLTGDGALIEFASAVDALSAAIEFQQAMAEANDDQPADAALVFRMGLHLGDLIVDGDDLYGDGVNVAARLEGAAPAGGILISRNVHDAVAGRVKATFGDLGNLALKNIERPIQAYSVKWEPSDWQPGTAVPPKPAPAPTALPLPDKPSIAVLPFQNMSGDPEQEYFVDGMAEDIITALSRFPTLLVIARNSSFTYKGKAVDIKQVGRELGVRYVLEGGVRKGGNRIRITAQLIDASTGNHVWADRYDRELTDVFAVQDEITATITARLGTSIERVEIDVSGRKSPSNLGAYDYYLRARAFQHNSSGREEGLQARAFCEKAIEIDPQFAPPYAQASYFYSREVSERWDVSRRQEAITKGLAMATRAIALDPALSIAHMTMGMLLFRARDYKGAATSGLRAIELNPNDPESYVARGNMLYYTNNSREALALFQKAQLLDPFYPPIYDYFLGRCYLGHGELDHAIVHSRACSRRLQNFWPPQAILAAAYAHAGDMVEAQAALAEMMRLYPVGSLARYKQEGDYQPGPETDYLYEGLRLAGLPE